MIPADMRQCRIHTSADECPATISFTCPETDHVFLHPATVYTFLHMALFFRTVKEKFLPSGNLGIFSVVVDSEFEVGGFHFPLPAHHTLVLYSS